MPSARPHKAAPDLRSTKRLASRALARTSRAPDLRSTKRLTSRAVQPVSITRTPGDCLTEVRVKDVDLWPGRGSSDSKLSLSCSTFDRRLSCSKAVGARRCQLQPSRDPKAHTND